MISTSPGILILVAVAVMISLVLLVERFLFRILFSYEIRENDVVVRLFHFLPLYQIPYENIIEIRSAPVWEVALVPGMHLFTRPFAKRVVIQQRNRWFAFAFLTPENPDRFMAEIRKRMVA